MNRRLLSHAALPALALLFAACGPKAAPATKPTASVAAASPAAKATAVAAAPTPTPEVTPVEPDLVFPANDAFRDKQPPPGPTPAFKQPKVETFKLPGGIAVWLVERHELPTVELTLYLEGGTMDDPKGKEGQVALCTDLLTEGTAKLDRLGFDAALADLGSSVGSFASADEVGVNMRSLTKNLDATLDLWADSLLAPRLDAEELARDVKSRKEGLRSIRANPSAIAGRLANGIVFGPDQGYARVDTEASLGAITIDDCRTFAKGLAPKGAKLFVVGDVTRAQLQEKVGKRLAAFKGKSVAHAKPGAVEPRPGRVFFVDVPGAQQSVVAVLSRGPKRKAPDYYPTALMSAVLGGGFASRINMNLREAHGYTYGARAGFGYLRDDGIFSASSSVRTDVTMESLHELMGEIHRIRDADVTDAELDREKKGSVLSLPAAFATGAQILGSYRSLVYYGLPLDYYDHLVASVQAVTVKQARAAAVAHIHPEEMKILVVGDAKTQVPRIRDLMAKGELGAGDLVMLDPDGKVVP